MAQRRAAARPTKKATDDILMPNDIKEAIEFAIEQGGGPGGEDPRGTAALRFDFERTRSAKQGKASWIPTQINVKTESGRAWKEIRVMIVRVPTKANIVDPATRGEDGKQADADQRIQLQFHDGDTFTVKTAGKVVTQEYGKAMLLLHYAWRAKAREEAKRKTNNVFKQKGMGNNSTRFGILQTHRKKVPATPKKGGVSPYPQDPVTPEDNILIEEDDEDPSNDADPKTGSMVPLAAGKRIIRVQIEFEQKSSGESRKIENDAAPKINIYDATKKTETPNAEGIKNEVATVGEDEEPLTYSNICKFIPAGSEITGVIDLSSTTLSNMGISIPGKFMSPLLVKPGAGRAVRSFAGALVGAMGDDEEEDEADGAASSADAAPETLASKVMAAAGNDDDDGDNEPAKAAVTPAKKAAPKASAPSTPAPSPAKAAKPAPSPKQKPKPKPEPEEDEVNGSDEDDAATITGDDEDDDTAASTGPLIKRPVPPKANRK
jgi:hypothetical protein